MRAKLLATSLVVAALLSPACSPGGRVVQAVPGGPPPREHEAPQSALQVLLNGLSRPTTVQLPAGTYELGPVPFRDTECPTCTDPKKPVAGTLGLRVRGRGIHLVGAKADDVVIRTGSGYGILFDACEDCSLENVTVTGGVRDLDPDVPVAAVVVHGGRVRLSHVRLADNLGTVSDETPGVSGIAGVVVRGGGVVTIEDSQLVRNSGDGAWVTRGSRAEIRRTLIDGRDKGLGRRPQLGGGGGAGLTVDFDGTALLEGSLITRTWMGVRVLRDGSLEARRNAIEDVDSVGLLVDDFGDGAPRLVFEDNSIMVTGACGAKLVRKKIGTAEAPSGAFRGNAVALTGQNPDYDPPQVYCSQVAVDAQMAGDFVFADNAYFRNRSSHDIPGANDLSNEGFVNNTAALRAKLKAEPLLATCRLVQAFR